MSFEYNEHLMDGPFGSVDLCSDKERTTNTKMLCLQTTGMACNV
jgi:hypothetical protein